MAIGVWSEALRVIPDGPRSRLSNRYFVLRRRRTARHDDPRRSSDVCWIRIDGLYGGAGEVALYFVSRVSLDRDVTGLSLRHLVFPKVEAGYRNGTFRYPMGGF